MAKKCAQDTYIDKLLNHTNARGEPATHKIAQVLVLVEVAAEGPPMLAENAPEWGAVLGYARPHIETLLMTDFVIGGIPPRVWISLEGPRDGWRPEFRRCSRLTERRATAYSW
jgi:hypothetical protein